MTEIERETIQDFCSRELSYYSTGAVLRLVLKTGSFHIAQELCESRGGRPGLSVLTSLLVSVDVKL